MSNREYRIDGRDPNAKGYVKENRMANQQETDKIVEALESFGYKNVDGFKFHLYGRLDDVHGWYLFGISKEDDERENFLILGDCLDVLEGPTYNKVVGLDEVMHYARTAGSGDNVGTAYDAMQTWGVFKSLSQGFCDMVGSIGVCIENERAHWDNKSKEWKLSYDVRFDTDMSGNEKVTITIPAQLGTQEEADSEFLEQLGKHCQTIIRKKQSEEEVSVDEQGYVWVMTIMVEGLNFPEVHKTFDGAVESAINDIKEKMSELEEEEREEYDFDEIKKRLEEDRYWKDENTETTYDIVDCPVSK